MKRMLALVLAVVMLASCSTSSFAQTGRFVMDKTNDEALLVITDTETGCMYLVFREYASMKVGGFGMGGMCQLTDADGKPLLNSKVGQ